MKTIVWCILVALFLSFGVSAQAFDVQKTASISWTYADPPADLDGFKIYKDGVYLCEAPADVRDIDCYFTLSTPTTEPQNITMGFTMTAFDLGGNESNLSNEVVQVVVLDPPPGAPRLDAVQVGIK